jgi:DNA-directed RNA polymerase subunit RPC12/RpoP
MKPFEPTHYWICVECATKFGGVWPEGHVATMILDKCKYCDSKIKEALAPWVDYNWSSKSLTKRAIANRD